MDRNQLLGSAYRAAFEYERRCRGCAQSCLAALQDVFDIRDDPVFRSASGLGGGVGMSLLGSCGALTGGAMAISQLFGRTREEHEDPQKKRMRAYRLCDRLARRFMQEYGAVTCEAIQRRCLGRSYDLWDEEDYGAFDQVAYRQEKCLDVVGKGAVWAAEIILDEMDRESDPIRKGD